ncbi:MAG: hypothetical protein ACE5IY_05600 [bacterium]
MPLAAQKHFLSFDEFLEIADSNPRERYEYYHGEIVLMSETFQHAVIKQTIATNSTQDYREDALW